MSEKSQRKGSAEFPKERRLYQRSLAFLSQGEPEVVTIDKSGANATALVTLNADKPDEATITIRQRKYLNNPVEQNHRNIKRRVRPMLGFKFFRRVQTILAGIELIHMIHKGQYQRPAGDGMSPAEQFYLLVAGIIDNARFYWLTSVNATELQCPIFCLIKFK